MNDITVDELYNHPIVQQILQDASMGDLESEVTIPYVIKDKILMSPGRWNGLFYSPDSIRMAFESSDFSRKEIRSLFLDHEDNDAAEWIGEIRNIRMKGTDIVGDLVIVDKATAMKLHFGAKFGISPKLHGLAEGGAIRNFTFDNWSVVINPAVKTTYINNSEGSRVTNEIDENAVSPQAVIENATVSIPGNFAQLKEYLNANQDKTTSEALKKYAQILEDKKKDACPHCNSLSTDLSGKLDEILKVLAGHRDKDDEEDEDEEENKAHDKDEDDEEKSENSVSKKNADKPDEEDDEDSDAEEASEENAAHPDDDEDEDDDEESKENSDDEGDDAAEGDEKLSDKDKQILELREKLKKVESKLNEPSVTTVQTEELRQKKQESDMASGLMEVLKRQGGCI